MPDDQGGWISGHTGTRPTTTVKLKKHPPFTSALVCVNLTVSQGSIFKPWSDLLEDNVNGAENKEMNLYVNSGSRSSMYLFY